MADGDKERIYGRDYNHAYWLQQACKDSPSYEFWIGCEHPEKPYDKHVLYVPDCEKCIMHAKAAISTGLATTLQSPWGQELQTWVNQQEESNHGKQ